jgi:hypothetical protein
LLNDQSGSVLGDSTVFSWAGCHRGLAFAGKVGPEVLLDFGSGPELRPHTTTHRQHLRLLLPARAYSYRREDLHEDANAIFN